MSELKEELKHRKLIIGLSVVIPLAVAALFGIKIDGYDLHFLPPVYATINGITSFILIAAVWAIKSGKRNLHEMLMKTAIAFSCLFLLLYIAYHITSTSTPFGGEGIIRPIYFFILISHILLSIAIIPLVLLTFVRGISSQFAQHRKLARITFPLWLYVTVTGVIVYFMISPYYPQ